LQHGLPGRRLGDRLKPSPRQTDTISIERVMSLGALSEEDERALLHILDSLEARSKLKELAAGVG